MRLAELPFPLHRLSNDENQGCEIVPAFHPGTTTVWEPFDFCLQNREPLFVMKKVLDEMFTGFPDFI